MTTYYVCCFDDNGLLTPATQKPFTSHEAAEAYARTVSYGREPFVVAGLTPGTSYRVAFAVNEEVAQCSSTDP